MLEILVVFSFIVWLAILLLPWQPWRNNEVLPLPNDSEPLDGAPDLSDVTVVIPARDEAPIIARTLRSLLGQGVGLRVLLIDDNSTDGTPEAARAVSGLNLTIITGEPLPPGWAGKLWALEQGVRRTETPLCLMLDADIALSPGVIAALKAQMCRGRYEFVSVMASLSMRTFWEKLLTPSFIYFFKMLYPFRLARSSNPRFYAAAGGCIMAERRVLLAIGGLSSIRGALIDDCALAGQVKRAHFRTWIGQSRAINSIRPYRNLAEIWNMVARSAFTQLRYSALLLLLTTCLLVAVFVVPVAGSLLSGPCVRPLAALAWAMMAASYLPTLRFYGLGPFWALAMPLIGALYLGMTWTSAWRYWRGERSRWKGRIYR